MIIWLLSPKNYRNKIKVNALLIPQPKSVNLWFIHHNNTKPSHEVNKGQSNWKKKIDILACTPWGRGRGWADSSRLSPQSSGAAEPQGDPSAAHTAHGNSGPHWEEIMRGSTYSHFVLLHSVLTIHLRRKCLENIIFIFSSLSFLKHLFESLKVKQ